MSWDDVLSGNFPETPARKGFRQAVEEVAQKAREVLPVESEGRILKAVQLVLAGDVTLLENGSKARVASQSNGTTEYFIANGECQCRDFTNSSKGNAPANFFCKHRLAYGIYKRAYALAKQRLAQLDAATNGTTTPVPDQATTEALVPVPPQEPVAAPVLPEAPASANAYVLINGHRVQVTLRDYNEETLLERMTKILERFPAQEPKEDPKPEGWCSKHNAPMKLNHGKRGSWWSHKTADGQWCNNKK